MRAFLLPAVLIVGCRPEHRPPPELTLTVSGTSVAARLQRAFEGASLQTGKSDRNGTPAVFVLGPAVGSRRFPFTVPKKRIDLGWAGEITYRLGSLYLTGCRVETDGQSFLIQGDFASRGPTLLGSHSALGPSVVPDLEMRKMHLEVRLSPALDGRGRPTYGEAKVRFGAEVASPALRFHFQGHTFDLLESVSGYQATIRQAVEGEVLRALRDERVHEAATEQIWRLLQDSVKGLKADLTKAEFVGTDLRLTLRAKGKLSSS